MTAKFKTAFQNPLVPENLAQAINPWSWWFDTNVNQNQNGFINVTTYKSGNPKLEASIVNEVAGYGMQLGVIEDMIEMMIGFLPKSQLSPQQAQTIAKFKDMTARIAAHKEKNLLEHFSTDSVDDFVQDLKALKIKNPALYESIAKRLKRAEL